MAETPPMKKQKLCENIDEYIENIMNSNKNLTPVLKDDLYESIQTKMCYAGHIKDPKLISKTIQILNDRIHLEDLQHLKRVYRQSILVCSEEFLKNTEFSSIHDFIEQKAPELKNVFDYIRDVQVPSKPPLTMQQNVECNKQWSCNFHPNKYIQSLVSGKFFTQTDLHWHRTYMGMALHVAKSLTNKEVTKQDFLSSDINAAVVVDSGCQSVVAIACDNKKNHPTQHAAMAAIDNVAKTQNGGAWSSQNELEKEILWKLKHKFITVKFGAKEFVSKKEAKENDSLADVPYLCTGYDVYLVREPCFMCAMGLIHARAKRVFYMFDNSVQGALRTKTKLHCLPGLNHRYEVFTGFDI